MTRERAGLVFAALCAFNGAFTASISKLNTNLADASFVAATITVLGALCSAAQLAWRG